MSTSKHIDKICIIVLILALIGTVLFMNGKALGLEAITSEDDSTSYFTNNDLESTIDEEDATFITLSDEGTDIDGNGAYTVDGTTYIAYAGTYVISGSLSDGNIIVEADRDDKIWLVLAGVDINCETDAAIRVEQADKVFLNLKEGTENTLTSGSEYDEDVVENGVDGTIYSRDDLTINGSGSLTVNASYQHGIVGNDDFVITGGTLVVEAAADGIHTNDSARFTEADVTITAGDDGVSVSNDDETAYIYVESGTITITECYEGLEAVSITIAGGDIDITSSDDGLNANGSGEGSVITITGGNLTITNANGRDADGIDSNQNIYIEGGNILVSLSSSSGSAIDYGSENNGICQINGGTMIACGGSSMLEGISDTSSQYSIIYGLTESAADGSTLTLSSSDGTVLAESVIPNNYNCAIVSTPEIVEGETYTLTCGDTSEEITIDSVVTTVNVNISSMGGMGGGGMGGGNMGGGPGGQSDQDTQTQSTGEDQISAASSLDTGEAATESSSDTAQNTDQNMPQRGDGNHQPPDMSDSESGERPQRPDMSGTSSESGEMPQMPEMSASSSESGEMPEMSASSSESGEMPQMSGGPGGDMGGEQGGGMSGGPGMEQSSAEETSSIDPMTVLLIILISGGVLAIGILIASKFKGRGLY